EDGDHWKKWLNATGEANDVAQLSLYSSHFSEHGTDTRRALAGKKRIIIEDLKEVDPYFTCILSFLRYANLKATIVRDRGDKKQHDDVTLPKWQSLSRRATKLS
ncbi:hypothetical protein ALC56_04480, partial [Trachymyrmex septentrionalis]